MDEFARQIGWIAIGLLAFYVIGNLLISHSEAEDRKKDLDASTWDHQERLALRKIWRTSQDPEVIGKIKRKYGAWSILFIELSDKEYDLKMRLEFGDPGYYYALKEIETHGLPYVLEDGNIVATYTDIYKNRAKDAQNLINSPTTNKPQGDGNGKQTN